MKRLVIGILAHVDAGKTTLSEAMLYQTGHTQKIGRVDHGDAFLDTDKMEKDRGITIFSKQAVLSLGDMEMTLVDTPGHVDFSAEAERTLRVLDYAILVISGSEGVQSHTETLWKLLRHYDVPTFIFINKMDLEGADKQTILADLTERLDVGCVDFSNKNAAFFENVAMASGELLEEYIETEQIGEESLKKAIASREVFPSFFGSALKMDGIDTFLEGLSGYTQEKIYGDSFGAKVYKISEDDKGQRLAFMKITSGSLQVKEIINGNEWSQKVNELRVYSGAKYKSEQVVYAGSICAVPGLLKTYPGEGLGCEPEADSLILEPVFTYSVVLPPETDMTLALGIFRKIEEEETQMHVIWNEHLQKIDVQVMGEVQLEVLKRILEDRFGLSAQFAQGSIIYKETIQASVEGVGHYEPLRHYAEVHLLLEPAKRGSGVVFSSNCSEDVLERNWQRLIMTHLSEKTHRGVLSGAPITDIKITLVNGRAHQKHTDGGDFRQATYRAVRQGLMQAESLLLEPYYSFTLEVPTASTGRALTDLQRMEATFSAPELKKEMSVITGVAPISKIRDYHAEVISYTHGLGRLSCIFKGYEPCQNQEEVIKSIGYNPDADLENTANSVFCTHGSSFTVAWDEVFSHMDIPALRPKSEEKIPVAKPQERRVQQVGDEELLRIFESTYGPIERRLPGAAQKLKTIKNSSYKIKAVPAGPEFLLIDGYNIIFAWEDLKKQAEDSLEDARDRLIQRIANYRAMRDINIILVFDAYKVKGNQREIESVHGVSVVYTKEAETADCYIEKTTKELCKNYHVKVATSDSLEQIIIFGHGAVRLSAKELYAEVLAAEEEMREIISQNNLSQ
ncbi:MAG: TetM/TetW/TetO/TetS family tetracycline resistance ribosomal protection protein [Clostridia bacterium]|nr:TetM/TetW/TetO/TetS family tetracycline resistance ribosomal protection protein [Clostridia bacterium]